MTQSITLYAAQINPVVGDIAGNAKRILNAYKQGVKKKADLVLLPEMALSGYSPEDLIARPHFMEEVAHHAMKIADHVKDTALIFGTPWQSPEDEIHNVALFLHHGDIVNTFTKTDLPNYGVFDEARHFTPAKEQHVITFKDITLGLPICRDIWNEFPCKRIKELGADVLLSINASPYETHKQARRVSIAHARTEETGLPLLYLNLWGGQDELLFDGRSFTMNPGDESPQNVCAAWEDDGALLTLSKKSNGWRFETTHTHETHIEPDSLEDIYTGLTAAIRDYTQKTGFSKVLLGLSGGIDSALTAALAVDALGAKNVHAVLMPSPYTSKGSITDAKELAENMGITLSEAAIENSMNSMANLFKQATGRLPEGVSAENIQARLRGNLLMALSNSTGALLLTTGNKSEMAVGYATLYGDMAGGFAVLKDVYKTTVFELCTWRNQQEGVKWQDPNTVFIPKNIIAKPPSAELRPDQKDEDSLPPYDILDTLLTLAIEERLSHDAIVAKGYKSEMVTHVLNLLKTAEYKRRQSPPGPKITCTAFGRDWRYPIASSARL